MRTVLITDDDYLIRWSLSQAMRDRFLVFTAETFDEALDILKRAPVDALVLDLNLRGRDGLELLEIVRRNHPDLPVIVLTAYGCPSVHAHVLELGARACLDKPCSAERLMGVLDAHMAPEEPLRLEYARARR